MKTRAQYFSMLQRFVQLAALVVLGAAMGGCATNVTSTNGNQTADGLRYYLPLNVISVQSTKNTTTTTTLEFKPEVLVDDDADSDAVLKACFPTNKEVKYSVNLDKIEVLAVADHSNVYTLRYDPEFFSRGELAISRTGSGTLKSLAIKSEGRADEAAIAGLKAVGTIAGAAVGLSTPPIVPSPIFADSAAAGGAPAGKVSCFTRVDKLLKDAQLSGEFTEIQVATFLSYPSAIASYIQAGKLRDDVDARKAVIAVKEQELNDAKPDDFVRLSKEIKLLEELQARKTADIAAYAADVAARQVAMSKKLGLGEKKESKTSSEVFQIDELSPDLPAYVSLPDEVKELAIALTLTPLSPCTADKCVKDALEGNEADAYIAYRDPKPYGMTVYRLNHPKDSRVTHEVISNQAINLLAASGPVGFMPFESSSTGDRNLELVFSEGGVLVDTKFSYTASGEATASALDQGSAGLLANYQSSLEASYATNEAMRKEKLAEIQYSVDNLNRQKDLLEARLAVDNAETDLQAQRQLTSLNAQLQELEVQHKILVQEQSSASLAATAAYDTQLAALQSQLALQRLQATGGSDTELAKLQSEFALSRLQEEYGQLSLAQSNARSIAELQQQLNMLIIRLQILQQEKSIDELQAE